MSNNQVETKRCCLRSMDLACATPAGVFVLQPCCQAVHRPVEPTTCERGVPADSEPEEARVLDTANALAWWGARRIRED